MISGNLYAMTGIVCTLVCVAILRCNNTIYDRENTVRSYFSFLLVNFIICGVVDSIWGLMSTGTLFLGRTAFSAVSFLIHFLFIFTVACWCIFLTSYFGFKETRMIMILQCIPLAFAVIILAAQLLYGNIVFNIDENCTYSAGPFRISLFYIQYSYSVIAMLKVVYFIIKNREELTFRHKMIVFECSMIPVIFGVIQYLAPDGPYCIIGQMFSSVFVFNGMMVIEKHRRSQNFETISKETYRTLEAVSEGYVTVLMIDPENDEINVIKASPYVEEFLRADMPLREKIIIAFENAAEPEYKDVFREFADIDLLPAKMENRRSVSIEYRSKENGWSVATFIAAERDEERNLKKTVLAVQSVDEVKKKEQQYESALSRAYRDENAVMAELIKMESTGVVASRSRKIVIVNDAALEMFGFMGSDPIGMDVFEFWKDSPIKTSDDVKTKFFETEKNGGSFSYQTIAYYEGNEKDMRYLMTDVKRVDLLDGSKVMIMCFTDITAGKLLEDKLRTLSETDPLTNIANRRCGESQIRLLMQEGVEGIFCLFDVNGFKMINDNFGHGTGDDTLIAVSNAIRLSFRAEDIIMRLGGDEFAIYMRGVTTVDLARIRIARLFENIARIELENIPKGSVTVSLGAVIVRAHEGRIIEDYSEIYKRADAQMYKCKGRPGSNLAIAERKEDEKP